MAFLSSIVHPWSQDASNLQAMGHWLKVLSGSKLGTHQSQAQKNVKASNKALSEGAMLGVVDTHMEKALKIIQEHPFIEGQDPYFGNNASHLECQEVQLACLLGMSFGHLPSPRPGMLRHLTHPTSPMVSFELGAQFDILHVGQLFAQLIGSNLAPHHL